MAYTTLTRYLKLKVDSDLSADAVYNLQRIDALASTFVIDATEKLKIQSKGNIEIEPNDLALGGSGTGGSVEIGTSQHSNVDFKAFTSSFKVDSGVETKNQATGKTNYLKLAFESSTDSDPRQLKFDLGGTDRNISFDSSGTVVTKDSNGDVSIAGDMTAATFVGNLTGNVTGSVTGNADTATLAGNVTGIVAIVNGGTGNNGSDKDTALLGLLPTGSANQVLALNPDGDGLEWKAAGAGEVIEVTAATTAGNPIVVGGTQSNPTIDITKADTDTDGYLSSTDWDTFNNKEPAITGSGNASQFWNGNKTFASLVESDIPTLSQAKVTNLTTDLSGKEPSITAGTTGQYWRGDKSWQTLDKSAVSLSNVDNTSDANKPISSATQTALNAKYDASNPSNFVDAAGAKSAAVVNSTAGSETDQAPSVSAMKSYVTANSGPKFSTTWGTGSNSLNVQHDLGTREVSITIYDESYQTVYIDSETRTDNNNVALVRAGTATGTWTVIIKKL